MGHYWREMASEEELREHDRRCEHAQRIAPETLNARITALERKVKRLMAIQNAGQFPQLTTKMTAPKSTKKSGGKRKGRGC